MVWGEWRDGIDLVDPPAVWQRCLIKPIIAIRHDLKQILIQIDKTGEHDLSLTRNETILN